MSLVVTGANNSVAYNGSVQTNSGATATVKGSAVTITGNTIATGIGGQSFALSGYGSGTNASATPYADSLQATAGSGTTASNYNISYTNAGLTINKANAYVIIGSGQSSTYGSTPTITYTLNANAAGTGSAITTATTGTAVITNAPSATSDATSYSLTYASGLNSTNYSFNPAASSVSFTVNPKPLLITGQTAINKTYDGTTSAVLNSDNASLVGVVGSDPVVLNAAAAYGSFASADVGNSIPVTVQGNALSGSAAGNYTLSQPTGLSANITKAPLTVTADNVAKFVGQGLPSSYTVSYSGFVQGQTAANSGVTAGSVANSANISSGAGTYTLTPSGFSANNYSISYVTGTYTITPVDTLLVQAGSHTTTYGNNVSLTPGSVQYYLNGTGVVNLNYVSSIGNTYTYNDSRGGNVTFTLSPANAVLSSSNNLSFGSYQISGGNLIQSGSINLIGTGVYTGSLSVGQKAVTASASSVSKVYDGTTAMNGLSISLSPVISGDQVTAGGSGAFAQKNAGSNINYSVSNLALSGVDSNNYYLTGGTNFSGSNGVITPATLTYTATRASSTYGSTPSVNAGSVTGFVSSENQANATSGGLLFSTNATSASGTGTYAINGSGLTANNGNYIFTQAAGNATALTITAAPLPVANSGVGVSVAGCIVGVDEVKDLTIAQVGLCVAVK